MTRAFMVPTGGGDPRWVTGSLDTIKVTAEQTGGALGLIESTERKGDATPVHIHTAEDEAYYVVEGLLMFFIGDESFEAPAGSVVFAPRGVPHAYRVESESSRIIAVNVPGGWEGFFAEAGSPAAGTTEPPQLAPDLEALASLAQARGVSIVGDPPE